MMVLFRKNVIWILCVLFGMHTLNGADFKSASEQLSGELASALDRLDAVRSEVREERIPLARERNDLESRIVEKRREADRLQRLADNRSGDLEGIKTRLSARKEENEYLRSLLSEYMRSFETRVHLAELPLYSEVIENARVAREDDDADTTDQILAQLDAVESSMSRMETLIGGQKTQGEAITADGRVVSGEHLLFGPFSYFAGGENGIAGLTEARPGSLRPTLIDLGSRFGGDVAAFAAGSGTTLPVDVTGGNAVQIAEGSETFLEHIQAGGVVMIPILLLALCALVVAVWKWMEIAGVKRAEPEQVEEILAHLSQGKKAEAIQASQRIRGPVGNLLETAVKYSGEKKEILEELLYEKVLSAQPKLTRLLPFIALTAATAPLLGLLGTVTGMINTFKLITIFGTGDARLLSGGISEALVTTEFGLIIAIPALLAHGLLSRKAKGVVGSMEQTAVAFINGLSQAKSKSPGSETGLAEAPTT